MSEKINVLIEVLKPRQMEGFSIESSELINLSNFKSIKVDDDFEPISMEEQRGFTSITSSMVIRASIDEEEIAKLKDDENVLGVWNDSKIAPFESAPMTLRKNEAQACPFSPCDCSPLVAKGDIVSVAKKLGVNQIWNKGFKGEGIVIGIVDGGISAKGKVPNGKLNKVIGGYPDSNWGTVAGWKEHGNMSATDAQGMAPDSSLYDIRISDGNFISKALSGFQWAINRFKADGTPHILSNSWGIYQESWDVQYANDPNHIFTRKVVEAINLGIVVLFAAGNCGETCPDERCDTDIGTLKSIWGANGHPLVITVGAVNELYEYIGYSSVGPAALDNRKPDICGISHFKGYFSSDTGTSAACPIVAGVVALLKESAPSVDSLAIKNVLNTTARQLQGSNGWNKYSGHGVIQPKQAFHRLNLNRNSNSI